MPPKLIPSLLMALFCCASITYSQTKEIDSLLKVEKRIKQDTNMVVLKNKLSYYFYYIDPKKTDKFAKEALELSKKLSYKKGIAESICNIGVGLELTGNYKAALVEYNKVIAIAQENGFTDLEMNGYTFAGLCYDGMGNPKKAIDLHLKSIRIAERTNNEAGLGNAYNNISGSYYAAEQFKKCLIYVHKGEKTYRNFSPANWVNSLNNLGMIYTTLKDTTKAIQYFESAIFNAKKINNQRIVAQSATQLGSILIAKKQYGKAFPILKNAEKIQKIIEDNYNRISVSLFIAKIAFLNNDFKTAASKIKTADSLMLITDANSLLKEIYHIKSEFYKKQGDFQNALFFKEKWSVINDSVNDIAKNEAIIKLESKYNDEKKDLKIDFQNKSLHTKSMLNYLFIGLFLVVCGFLYSLLKNRIKDKKLFLARELLAEETQIRLELENELKQTEAENLAISLENEKLNSKLNLDLKNQELASSSLNLVQKNKILTDLKNDFERNSGEKKLVKKLENIINSDQDWEAFKNHFEKIHHGFFDRLTQKYPKISSSEQRLCAYLRMNINSKDLSKMLNIAPVSLDKSRQRLRKKLEIEPEINLITFLKDF